MVTWTCEIVQDSHVEKYYTCLAVVTCEVFFNTLRESPHSHVLAIL